MNLYNKYYVPIIVGCYILGCIMSISFCDDNMISFHRDKSSVSFYDFLPFDRFAFIAKNNLIVAITEMVGLSIAGYIGLVLSYSIFASRKIATFKKVINLSLFTLILIILSSILESYVSMDSN